MRVADGAMLWHDQGCFADEKLACLRMINEGGVVNYGDDDKKCSWGKIWLRKINQVWFIVYDVSAEL